MLRFFRKIFIQGALKSDFSPRFKILVKSYVLAIGLPDESCQPVCSVNPARARITQ
jgi:hypothetical protein